MRRPGRVICSRDLLDGVYITSPDGTHQTKLYTKYPTNHFSITPLPRTSTPTCGLPTSPPPSEASYLYPPSPAQSRTSNPSISSTIGHIELRRFEGRWNSSSFKMVFHFISGAINALSAGNSVLSSASSAATLANYGSALAAGANPCALSTSAVTSAVAAATMGSSIAAGATPCVAAAASSTAPAVGFLTSSTVNYATVGAGPVLTAADIAVKKLAN